MKEWFSMGLDWCLMNNADGTRPSETAKCPIIGPETKEQFREYCRSEGYCSKDADFEKEYEANIGHWFSPVGFEGAAPISGVFVGPFDYRGKVISEMAWLGDDITDRAFERFSPEDMMEGMGPMVLDGVVGGRCRVP